ncbi:MAG TPA: hypothetical protein VGI10_20275 [Polyangiaceae bacterium]
MGGAALVLSFGAALGCSNKSDAQTGATAGSSAQAGSSGSAGNAQGGSNAQGGATAQGGSAQAGSAQGGNAQAGSGGTGMPEMCDGGPCNTVPGGLLDPKLTTTWNPGILSDGQLNQPLGPDGLPVRTTICKSPMPGDDLQAALDGCAAGQVVALAADTYTISSTLNLTKGVVLRGAGSAGAGKGGTTLVRTGGGAVIAIGSGQDQVCYASGYGTGYALTADASKEQSTVTVGDSASQFAAGDLALLDEVDDATIQEGDCQYFKRVDKRSVSERVEVKSVDSAAGTITLSTPLHWTFRSTGAYAGQIAKVNGAITRYAGVENLALQGGTNPGYDGQAAGGIDMSNAAYCWVKDVQTDGTIGGMHVAMTGTYRSVVRDSNFHHSANYGFGADCYGIVLRCGAADNLVENNIARYMNKPILFSVSGGGNVVGYNYADNSWATPAAWQEVNIDEHCSFPHMELVEGNYAPHMGLTATHGNAGYVSYFRNYSSGQFAPPAVANSTDMQTGNMLALQLDVGDLDVTVVGNVFGSSAANDLGTAPVSSVYISTDSNTAGIYSFGPAGKAEVAYTTLFWQANYDTVTPGVVFNPAVTQKTLPPSLYLAEKPAWWPAGNAFPWAGSDLTPRVGTLPAKARSDAL